MSRQGRSYRERAVTAARRVATLAAVCAILALAACSTTSPTGATKPPTPSPTATLTPDQLRAAQIAASTQYYLDQMSLDQKVGQMMLIQTGYTTYARDVDNMVHGMHAGAIILYKQNMQAGNPAALKSYIAAVQSHADLSMIVSMDEEGGGVDRLGDFGFAQPLPSPEATTNTHDPQNALADGTRAAKEMRSFGINTNLAPLADVRLISNPAILTTRMYGNDPATVDKFAGAFLQGVQDNGVIGCVKHWPGAGSLTVDPHKALPVMTRTKDQLESTEFASFRGMLALDPGMVMVTHVVVKDIDPTLPATLSPKLIQGTLRGELGYQGVVITDDLWMKAISDSYTLGQAAVLAVEAGDDLLAGAQDTATMRSMVNALKSAISSGQISQDRIDQSVSRILALKLRFGILPLHAAPASTPGASPTQSPSASAGSSAVADMPRKQYGA